MFQYNSVLNSTIVYLHDNLLSFPNNSPSGHEIYGTGFVHIFTKLIFRPESAVLTKNLDFIQMLLLYLKTRDEAFIWSNNRLSNWGFKVYTTTFQ